MDVEYTALQGVVILTPARHGDARGYFSESWNKNRMAAAGFDFDFVQDNHSLSHAPGTVRGLHFQTPPHAQAKVVRCGRGALLDVAVDIRKGSPTYAHWVSVELTAENGRQLLIPPGFMHGFATLLPDTEIIYKCSDYYAPDCDAGVRFDDPDIGVNWNLGPNDPILSPKDAHAPRLSEIRTPFVYEEERA